MFSPKNESPATPLHEFGEFALIEKLTAPFIQTKRHQHVVKGVGDDAAVIDIGNEYLLITSDILAEKIHFDFIYSPPRHLGYKMAVVNFSDIYAMNGKPETMSITMALSNKMSVEVLEEIYEGIRLACEHYCVDLVGGDSTSSAGYNFFSITVTGRVKKDRVVYRSGAQTHDLVCVTGDLGAAAAGLYLLEREKRVFLENPQVQPALEEYDYVLRRQLKPEARKDIIEWFEKENVIPSAMIDISDGLSSEILHISKASGKGITIYEEKIPIDWQTERVADEMNLPPIHFALNGGEDYELLFTVDQKYFNTLTKNKNISIIGYVESAMESNSLVTRAKTSVELKAMGWNAYQKE